MLTLAGRRAILANSVDWAGTELPFSDASLRSHLGPSFSFFNTRRTTGGILP